MPFGARKIVHEFSGSHLTASSHPEVDASSFTDALLHCSRASSQEINIHLEAAPEDFGTSPTWHRLYRGQGQSTALHNIVGDMTFTWTTSMPNSITISFPCEVDVAGTDADFGFIDQRVPRRFRIVKSQNMSGLAVELTRRRA